MRTSLLAFVLLALATTASAKSVTDFGVTGSCLDESTQIQVALDSIWREISFPPPPGGCYGLGTGLLLRQNNMRLRGESGWSQVGSGAVVFKALAPIVMLRVSAAQGFVIQGIAFDGASIATIGVSLHPASGGGASFGVFAQGSIHDAGTCLAVGLPGAPVVAFTLREFQITRCSIGVQQNDLNTGDITYQDGAIVDNYAVGLDLGSSQDAVLRRVSLNGQNGPGGDIRGGNAGTAKLTLENCGSANPTQGPYLNFAFVPPALHATQIMLLNCWLEWGGITGGRIIDYQGYGTVQMIGGALGGNGTVHVVRYSPVMYSGAKFIDQGVLYRGSPAPTVTAEHRFSVLPTYTNVPISTQIRAYNANIVWP